MNFTLALKLVRRGIRACIDTSKASSSVLANKGPDDNKSQIVLSKRERLPKGIEPFVGLLVSLGNSYGNIVN